MSMFWQVADAQNVDSNGRHHVKLRSGHYVPDAKVVLKKSSVKARLSNEELGGEYVIIQFHSLPTAQEKLNLLKSGINLLDYIPDYAYIARLDSKVNENTLKSIAAIRSVEPFKSKDKIDPNFANKASYKHAVSGNGEISMLVTLFKEVKKATFLSKFTDLGIKADTNTVYKENVISVKATFSEIEQIAVLDEVQYITFITPKPESISLETNANHRVNAVQSTIVGAKNLRGEGVVIGVGDNGVVFDHSDLQQRIILNDQSGNGIGEHATHVTGIIGGNGNLSDTRSGIATKSNFVIGFFSTLIYEAPAFINNYGMVLTNNSYHNPGVPTGQYEHESILADNQLVANPALLHVFASANPGSEYGLVAGAFASSKNILTVGSIDITNTIAGYSGRGPCLDGRLKPEIVSIGSDVPSTVVGNKYENWNGTSMAAPAVTGGLALMYEHYKKMHGSNPNAGLMKAIICNTADDLGNSGPDYTYGFGRMNIKKAVQAIEAGRYIQSSINAGLSKSHTITIPSGTSFLKVMLYWKDQAGSISSSIALVNNLNLSVTNGGTTYQPWVLNPTAPAAVATRSIDNLNNIEQVTFANPASGNCSISINGSGITTGASQDYFIAYEFVKTGIELTYPIGGEVLEPSKTEIIRWDSYGTSATTNLFYSTNNGSTWNAIASGIPTSSGSYTWPVPNLTNENVTFKAVSGSSTSTTTNKTVIIRTPIVTNERGNGNVSLSWLPVNGASLYEILVLKKTDKEIQSLTTTTSLSYTIPNVASNDSIYVSVRAVTATSKKGRRSYATLPKTPDCKFTATKITGTVIGSLGSWNNSGNTREKAFDGDINSYFDAQEDIAWAGLELAAKNKVIGIRYYPREGAAERMIGGRFQGSSTADFSSDVVELATITAQPAYRWNCIPVTNSSSFKYLRYICAAGGVGNVSEIEFHGTVAAVNIIPTVIITSPLSNTSIEAAPTITITANASDADGSILQVDFYIGSNIVGTDYTAPYSYAWNNANPGTYILTARAMDNEGGYGFYTITGVTLTAPTNPIVGPACGSNNSTLSFELSAAKRTNSTGYNWWYTGGTLSIAPVSGSAFKATILTGSNFSAGDICVGVNYSASPWYASYCKTVTKCVSARMASGEVDAETMDKALVAPNPTADQFNLNIVSDVESVSVVNEIGQTVYQKSNLLAGENVSLGENFQSGIFMLSIRYSNGISETKRIVKVK